MILLDIMVEHRALTTWQLNIIVDWWVILEHGDLPLVMLTLA